MTMTALELRVSEALAPFDALVSNDRIRVVRDAGEPVLATPLALAAAFAGGATFGGGLVAAFEAGRAVRGG